MAAGTKEESMDFPKIDLGSLPELDVATGLFGSLSAGGSDDTIVAIMVYVYDHSLIDMLL